MIALRGVGPGTAHGGTHVGSELVGGRNPVNPYEARVRDCQESTAQDHRCRQRDQDPTNYNITPLLPLQPGETPAWVVHRNLL